MEAGAYPDDPKERARIKAHILGAGAGPAMKVEEGKVRVEVEDGRKDTE